MTFLGLQTDLFAFVPGRGSAGEWWLSRRKGSRMCIPWDFLPSPASHSSRPSNLLPLDGAAPLTFLGDVKFLYYYCLLIFVSANHGSYRKFDQSEWDVVKQPLGPRGFRDPRVDGMTSSSLAGSLRDVDSVHLPPTTWEASPTLCGGSGVRAGVAESRQKTVVYKSFQRSFLMRYLYLFPDQ